MAAIIMSLSMLVATAAADCLSFSRNPHTSFAAHAMSQSPARNGLGEQMFGAE